MQSAKRFEMKNEELCARNNVTVHLVGEVYDHDEHGRPIPEPEKEKWFVAIRAGDFPDALVRSIPLADTEAEAHANAVKHLGLRNRCPVCCEAIQPQPVLQTPMWKMILFPALLICALLVGALHLDGVIDAGFEFTAPAFVVAISLAAVGLLAMFLSRKDAARFYCHQCGYSE